MPIIDSFGFILPNGRFLPNAGDGHAKNAMRFAQDHHELWEAGRESRENWDDIFIEAGCLVIAGYRGTFGIKYAKDNGSNVIQALVPEYQQHGYELWNYWSINPEYQRILAEILENEPETGCKPIGKDGCEQ